jgi:hypothetical protein
MKWIRAALRPLLLLAIFLVSLAIAAAVIGRIAPYSGVPMVKEKWEHWRRHKDEFDTVFIGTSRTYRGIMPRLFDELTAAAGVPTHSFNFGIDGMHAPEDAFVAEQLLADPPKNLRHVFLEIGVFADDFAGNDPDTVRTVYWHDWQRTRLCVRAMLWPKKKRVKWKQWFRAEGDDPSDASVASTHLRLFFSRSLNLGRGSTAWTKFALQRGGLREDVLGPDRDGFRAMKGNGLKPGHDHDEYMARYAERQREPAKVGPMNRYGDESLLRTVARVRAVGAKPYVLLAPTTSGLRGRPSQQDSLPIFDFCDLAAYPELFVPEHRTDVAHLTAAGADLFTRRVAEKFVAQQRPPSSTQR